DRGDSPTVVLTHGFTGDMSSMFALAERLAGGRRVIVPDLIGHGGSAVPDDPAPYRFAESAEQILSLVTELSSGPFDIVGYSMGGRLALQLAVSYPDQVRSVCLIGATPGIADSVERKARVDADAELAKRIETHGVEAFVEHWEGLPLFASQASLTAEVRRSIHIQRLSNDPGGLAMSLRGSGTGSMPALHDALAQSQVAMCWITGELDAKFSEIAAQVCATNQLFESVVIPDAGHAAHIERPAAVTDAITSFWAKLDV
ncbi:MAG: 2-succinyl-6-hydroxy-2,4-cyclohexadiene-1-carboxylate synthase, partial [Acidobacteria bacterium]|nr:2-succinyl-6-hydroxy-2,4-cyclohexadiene-1-carboxylate synthase [Acidobacteriota bacterium]